MERNPQRSPSVRTHRWVGASLAMAALAMTAQSAAQAAPATFAQFTQAQTGSPFQFTNNTTSATLGITTVTTPVNFNFLSGPDTTSHAATLTLTAVTNAPATSTSIAGSNFLDQAVNGGGNPNNDVLKITDNATGKTLLSLTFTGDILGFQNDSTAQLSGNSARGNTVTFSSDYGTFAAGANSYALGLTSINPVLAIGPGGFLNSFVSSVSGSFRSTFQPTGAVPEPASVAMFGTGLLATAVLASQRKRLASLRES